jgi:hypothetical protein
VYKYGHVECKILRNIVVVKIMVDNLSSTVEMEHFNQCDALYYLLSALSNIVISTVLKFGPDSIIPQHSPEAKHVWVSSISVFTASLIILPLTPHLIRVNP